MSKNKKSVLIGVGTVVALSLGLYFYYPHQNPVLAMCPDQYGTDDAGSAAYLAATNKWTNDFFDQHPDATMTDWAEARHQFYIDNHCTASLQRYEDAKTGKADPETMKKVDGVLRESLQ